MKPLPHFLTPFIIVEGPDNCGKSTMARELARRIGAVYWRLTCTPALSDHQVMRDYQGNAFDNINQNLKIGNRIVMDRFWPSDYVYGPIFRDEASLPTYFEQTCRELDATYIYCTRDNAVEEHAKARDPDHPYNDPDYELVVTAYQLLFNRLKMTDRVLHYHLDTAIQFAKHGPSIAEGGPIPFNLCL